MRFKGSESRKKRNKVAIATIAFLSMVNLNVYPTTHSKYIDEGTIRYSANIHPVYRGDVGLTLLGKGQDDAYQSSYKDAYFKFTFEQNDALTGAVEDIYEMQIVPSGACEILSTSGGTLDKSKNTITYDSAGKSVNEVVMHCPVSAISLDKQNVKVSVTIKETIKTDKFEKVIENYKDGSFIRTLDDYYKDYPLESKLKWTETYIDLPDTLPNEFYEQLKNGTLPTYLQSYLPKTEIDYDSIFTNDLTEQEKIYRVFRDIWLRHIVSEDYGNELVSYVTKKYSNYDSLFGSSISLLGLSSKKLEEHVMKYTVEKNLVGYARTDAYKENSDSKNWMYFSTTDGTVINNAFRYYFSTYSYLNGVKPDTDDYQLLMDYINAFAPNGIADVVLKNIKVEGLTYNKDDGKLEIDPNILTMANGYINKIIEIPIASPDMQADLAEGLKKYYDISNNGILTEAAVEWIKTKATPMSYSMGTSGTHEEYIVWNYTANTDKYVLFLINRDETAGKVYVQAKPFTYKLVNDVDTYRTTLSIEDKEPDKVLVALDNWFKGQNALNVKDLSGISESVVDGQQIVYKVPYSILDIPLGSTMLDTLLSKLPTSYSLDKTAFETREKEIDDLLSSTTGTRTMVVKNNVNNYILLTGYNNGSGSVYVTAKPLYANPSSTSKLEFWLDDASEDRLVKAVQSLDVALGVTTYGNIVHDKPLVTDTFITTIRTLSDGRTRVIYTFDPNQIMIPFDSNDVPNVLADGLEKYYDTIMEKNLIDVIRNNNNSGAKVISELIQQNKGGYYVWEYHSDDSNNANDYYVFQVLVDEKTKNNFVKVENFMDWHVDASYVDVDEKFTLSIETSFDLLKMIQALDTKYGVPLHTSLDNSELQYHVAKVTIEGSKITYIVPSKPQDNLPNNTKVLLVSSDVAISTLSAQLKGTYSFITQAMIDNLHQAYNERSSEVAYFLSRQAGIKHLVIKDGNDKFVLLTSHSTGNGTLQITAKNLATNGTMVALTDPIFENMKGPIQALDNVFGVATYEHPIHAGLAAGDTDEYIVRNDTMSYNENQVSRIWYKIPTLVTNSLQLENKLTKAVSLNAEEVMVNDDVKEKILEVKEIEKGQNQILDVSSEDILDEKLEVSTPSLEEIPNEEKTNVSEVDVEDTLKEKVDDNILTSDDESKEILEEKSIDLVDKTKDVEDETIISDDQTVDAEEISTALTDAPSVDSGPSLENTDNITPAVTEDVTNLNITNSLNVNLN